MRPQNSRKHAKGQSDHVDAWLISYADLITLLFMLFVIAVSVSLSRRNPPVVERPEHFAPLSLGMPHDDMYRALVGVVQTNNADRNISVERGRESVWVEMSALQFFPTGSADIAADQLPLLKSMLKTIAGHLKEGALAEDAIEVEGYTDDAPLKKSPFATNWELAAMRAARIVNLLVEEGIDPSRLRATSHASNHPVVPNADPAGNPIPENRNRNQRVVIKVGKFS